MTRPAHVLPGFTWGPNPPQHESHNDVLQVLEVVATWASKQAFVQIAISFFFRLRIDGISSFGMFFWGGDFLRVYGVYP